jgi:hypothetical protein
MPSIVAGSYLTIGIGQTYQYVTNVAVDGVGVDLSLADISFLAKRRPDHDSDADAIVNATSAGGQIVVAGANNNTVTVTLNAATTANYDEHPLLYWQLKVETSTGAVYGLDAGRMAIGRDVVRSVT